MYKKISVKQSLPGKLAAAAVKKDSIYVSNSYTRSYPFVAKKGKGVFIEDIDGNVFLDFTAGIAACSTGHSHPAVVKAIKAQAENFIHMSGTDFYYLSQINLAEKLAKVTPGGEGKKVFFGNSGAEAVEAAIKLARYHTKRPNILAFYGAFHGRTMGALSLTGSRAVQRKSFFPLMPGVTHTYYSYCYRCPYNSTYPKCDLYCVNIIEDKIFKTILPPEEVAAIFVEPIQGEGGYVVPPPEFHQRLYQLAKKYGILYVVDEVQSGMGRTGKMIGIEHFGITPDIIAIAKGIASGMPLGACVASKEIMDWGPGAHASTFGGNPISCEAALATIALLEKSLIKNAEAVGGYIIKRLLEMQKDYEIIGDIRGKGLMIGIELVTDRISKKKAITERNVIIQEAFKKGLLLLGCGENNIRFMPPLLISRKEADMGLSVFEDVLKKFK